MHRGIGRLQEGSLRWLCANLEHFRLPIREDERDLECIDVSPNRKACCELALASLLLSRDSRLRKRPEYRMMVRHLATQARDPYFSFNMMRRQNLFPFYLMIMLALEAGEQPIPGLRASIRRQLELGAADARESAPWHQIDLRYYLDLAALPHGMAGERELFRLSTACRLPSLTHMSRIDAYAVTHVLFYLADFGTRNLRPVLGDRFDAVAEAVTMLLGMFVFLADCDLVGELLICCRCLGIRPEPFHSAAWELLFSSQTPDGDLPRSTLRSDDMPEKPADAAEARFRANYHPTLVALLATLVEETAGGGL